MSPSGTTIADVKRGIFNVVSAVPSRHENTATWIGNKPAGANIANSSGLPLGQRGLIARKRVGANVTDLTAFRFRLMWLDPTTGKFGIPGQSGQLVAAVSHRVYVVATSTG